MTNFFTFIGHFLIGLTDSLSLKWVTGILFYTDPQTHSIMKQSVKLQKTLGRSIIQAGVITTLIPLIVRWFGFEIFYWILKMLSLLFTYTYLIFYNMDVTQLASQIIIIKTQRHPQLMPEPDVKQKRDLLWDMGNQLQSLIFELVYYTPMHVLLIVITLFDPIWFPWLLVIMDSFFNTAFYFFRKWPYDKYNLAFLEHHLPYALGYGFFVSLMTNIVLPSSMNIGGYLLISQWMIINALSHSPPHKKFTSFQEIWLTIKDRSLRLKLPNAYNIHRKRLVKDPVYLHTIMDKCLFMKSFFSLTARINRYLQEKLLKNDGIAFDQNSSANLSLISDSRISVNQSRLYSSGMNQQESKGNNQEKKNEQITNNLFTKQQ